MKPLMTLVLIGLSSLTFPLAVAAANQPIAQAQSADEAAARQAIIAEVNRHIGTTEPIEVSDLYIIGDYGIANWSRGEGGGYAVLVRSGTGWRVTMQGDDWGGIAVIVADGVPRDIAAQLLDRFNPGWQQFETIAANEAATEAAQGNAIAPRRNIAPDPTAQPGETPADRAFRVAFNAATDGDYDTAIINYQRAASLVSTDCERAYAQAGVQAATETKALRQQVGQTPGVAQMFWTRLQELTQSLSCTYGQQI